jgi:uncharacterized NAD(P)/FAD-binding protein YdhS
MRDEVNAAARRLTDEAIARIAAGPTSPEYQQVVDQLFTLAAELDAARARADWLWRAFQACNKDRRFAWTELKHENEVAVEYKKELNAARAAFNKAVADGEIVVTFMQPTEEP